ncbi:hypothetical protein NKR19_g3724 [Coniochaeta hoffmannii]|uniref:WSC domain-containing protein n=1 Tax=Coniochaeta hoffmannii TaxID=91930 RepID=A0AA38RWI2_9PEZI|nr:hypothetical protein NKR19_g3724 [Coniochaeta hoffmannii]
MFVKNGAALVAALSLLASADAKRQQLNERGSRCNGDNLLNRFRGAKYSDAAISFCQTYINSVTYSVVTVSTDQAHVSSPVTTYSTAYPTPLLTTSYAASRLSSACNCVSPSVVTAVVTEYVASTTSVSLDDAATSTSDDSATITEDPATPTDDPATSTDDSLTSATDEPSASATDEPSATVTEDPSATSTDDPSATITEDPSSTGTDEPSATATEDPSATSTEDTSSSTTDEPSPTATEEPSSTATEEPSATATDDPTASPTDEPTATPTDDPTTTPTGTPAAATPTSLGCYVEGAGGRALKNLVLADDALTISSCAAACSGTYAYFGVEFGRECWCDDAVDRTAFLSPDASACNMACKGDASETCGGSSTINIYGSADPQDGTTPTESPYVLAGCFAEPAGARALPQVYASARMTVELCHTTCSLAGYVVAALEYSTECWCGNAVPELAPFEGGCTAACAGDASETCGGSDALQLYTLAAS